MKWGKFIGAGLGFVTGGPIASILGFGLGSVFDELQQRGVFTQNTTTAGNVNANDFTVSTIVLASAVVKADGRTDDFEMSYIRTFLADQFGIEFVAEYILLMEHLLEQDFDERKVARQVRQNTSYEERLQMLHFLFGIASADFKVDPQELKIIERISVNMGLSQADFESIKAMFYDEMDAHYKILEVKPSSSDSDIKAAYREMVKKYHPDRMAHLGEGIQNSAKAKFDKVQKAYESIKRDRGFI